MLGSREWSCKVLRPAQADPTCLLLRRSILSHVFVRVPLLQAKVEKT